MRDFSTFLKIVRQLQKAIAFVVGFLGNYEFLLCGGDSEITLNDRDDETSRGDLGSRFWGRCNRSRSSSFSNAGNVERFVRIALADVFVHGIVGDEPDLSVDSGSLRVDRRVVVVDARQQRGDGLLFVFVRDACVSQCGLIDNAILTRPIERIRERKTKRRRIGRLLLPNSGDREQRHTKTSTKMSEIGLTAAHAFDAAW